MLEVSLTTRTVRYISSLYIMIVNAFITTKYKVSMLDGRGIRATVKTKETSAFRHEKGILMFQTQTLVVTLSCIVLMFWYIRLYSSALLAATTSRKYCQTKT